MALQCPQHYGNISKAEQDLQWGDGKLSWRWGEMVKLSWATKTFVHLPFYHLVPLLLQCLISLFARSLAWLFVLFFSSFLRFWLTGWLTDRLTYILPCWFSFFLFHFLFANSFDSFLFFWGHARPYLPTNIFILLLKPSLHPCACIAAPTCHLHLIIFSSISIRTAVYPSTIYCLAPFPASWLLCMPDISEDLLPTRLQRLGAWKKSLTDFAANPPFYRWTLRFGCFWKQTSATQGHPYPPVKSKYFNGISTRGWLSSPLLRCIGWRVLGRRTSPSNQQFLN